MEIGGTFNIYNLSTDAVDEILKFKSFHTNLLINVECKETSVFFNEMSNRNLINGSRRLLLYGNFDESIELLRTQNINLDSQIFVLDERNSEVLRVKSVQLRQGTKFLVENVKNASRRENLDLEGHILRVVFNVSIERRKRD